MKRFLIQTSVLHAEGSQTWYVDADSEEEALQKYNDGVCDLYSSEVDVTSLGKPDLAGETTLDDFGDFAAAAPLPVQEPPSEWVGIKAILDEYGLQAIDFVADFKAALAQPVQEPVGEVVNATDKAFECKFIKILPIGTKLYTTPPKREWVGLTDGEAGECHSPNYVQTVARIEAKLKEKNT